MTRHRVLPWTATDSETLRTMVAEGAGWTEIGRKLSRSTKAVAARAKRLQIERTGRKEMKKTPDHVITAKLEANKAFKTRGERPLTDNQEQKKAFDENRERLKAERLAREAAGKK